MTLLICNIGGSEINWDELGLKKMGERERGARLLNDEGYQALPIKLPLISKALCHAQRQGEISQVVLIASDQGAEPTDSSIYAKWQSDTLYTAQVVAQTIARGSEWAAIPAERITIWLIGEEDGQCDPSNYDVVQAFLERRLPVLATQHPNGPVFLELTGGAPAMTTGLLVAGSEVFGDRAQALYIDKNKAEPVALNISRRLAAGPLRATLRTHVANFNYDAALSMLNQQRATVTERLRPGAGEVLKEVLGYAHSRYSFDFPGAKQALKGGADYANDGRWRAELQALHGEVDNPNRTTLLAEVYHGAAARYNTAAYADFLTQVVRFQENALRMLCIDFGAEFVDRRGSKSEQGSKLNPAWATSQSFSPESYTGTMNRGKLISLVRHLTKDRGEDIEPKITKLNKLNELANLRNDLTHGFTGVHKLDLARRFGGEKASESAADTILPHLVHCLQLVTGRGPGDSPYARINRMIDDLLREG